MTSKRWTIVCLTLTLLIFGCTDSEMAKINAPSQPAVGAAALTSRTASVAPSAPALPSNVDVNERLDIPQQAQPPGLPALPGFGGMEVPLHFPGASNIGSPVDPKEVLGPGNLPTELPGFELPGFEGVPGAELLRLRQPGAIPAPTKNK